MSTFLDSSIQFDQIKLIRFDRYRKVFWIGTLSDVICCRMEGDEVRLVARYPAPSTPLVIECAEDAVYVGLNRGRVLRIDPGTRLGRIIQVTTGDNHQIRDIHQMKDGKLMVLAQMEDINLYDPGTGEIETIPYREQLGELFHLLDVSEDRHGNLWFATRDYGLVKMDNADRSFHFVPNTTCKTLTAVEFDGNDRLWSSSAYGLNMVSVENDNVVRYLKEDGIGGNQFNVRASCRLADGTVVFGGTHGITTCHQSSVRGPQSFPLFFEGLVVNGDAVAPNPKGAFQEALFYTPRVTLRHDQNNLAVSFAGLDYSRSQTILYQYKLDGYDRLWTSLGNDNQARFSSLPPGKYVLQVRATSSMADAPVTAVLPIRIKPALFASQGAICLYFLLLALVAVFGTKITRERVRLNLQLEQSERERQHEQLVNRVNMNFFADMAHEFRSPLTMIKGPMGQLLEERPMDPGSRKLLHIMNLSVERMLKLVNQLLNYNKLDNNMLSLSMERGVDIVAHCLKIVEMSSVAAIRHGIKLQTFGFESSFHMPLDPDKFESILSNLMSNALKFAGNDGSSPWIGVHFEHGADEVNIRVENSCRLFSADELDHLFDRYYQVREHAEHGEFPGTGIGLNYAWMLAARMHGHLSADNLPDGSGVRFTLTLPVSEDSFEHDDFVSPVLDRLVSSGNGSFPDSFPEEEETATPKSQTILIVDDDVDIANYLSILLSPYYNVEIANDADSADAILLSQDMPDVILSDILMPGTDGISFCKAVKANILTCHIPVILVTAKVGVSNEVAGLESGADAYVTKPFDPVYMLALIRSMLKNRSLLKGELAKSTSVAEVRGDLLSPRDAAFLEQLYGIMEEEMANPELDVQKICDKMCVSRTKLFYKVKSLTGMSTATIFRTFRLNMAAKMLREGSDNVSEVAYKVGFNSPSYFTRAFKAQFGVLPKDIAKS